MNLVQFGKILKNQPIGFATIFSMLTVIKYLQVKIDGVYLRIAADSGSEIGWCSGSRFGLFGQYLPS